MIRGESNTFDDRRLPTSVALTVVAVALAINAFSFAASQLWVSPDASYYVELAGGLADHADFRSQLFLIRPPGYPFFLAAMFLFFGSASPVAIMVAQHLMVVGVAYLITLIAWRMTQNTAGALASGLMASVSLQLITYANLVMTEVPFTLALVWAVYYLIVYHQSGRLSALAMASLLTGISYLFRPIGMALLPVCVGAALYELIRSNGVRRFFAGLIERQGFRNISRRIIFATAPACFVVLPCMAQNQLIHGGDLSTRCADLALYFRIVYMDKLDSNSSAALNDIRTVVQEARDKGLIIPDADYRLWGPVWQAYEKVRGVGLADSSRIMGRAARDLIAEHPTAVALGTVRYSFWMILVPDGFYRFHPDGAPGIQLDNGECRRDPNAAILASNTYEPMMRPWTKPYEHYLPLRSDATSLTPLWSGLSRWFYQNIEKGPSLMGIGDSPYEFFGWICFLGMALAMFLPSRGCWMIIIAAIAMQVVVSAFLAGPTPRYAVPVRPLLVLFPVAPFLLAAQLLRAVSVGLNGGGTPHGVNIATMSTTPSGLGSA